MYFQDRYFTEEQRMMRDTSRRYVDNVVIPFIQQNRTREWVMDPLERLAPHILEQADAAGLRSLGVPEQFGALIWTPPRNPRLWR
jgi:alkylation response protein AidB-like acyl-CoA dehydrogenase